jgi:hypothetical protein
LVFKFSFICFFPFSVLNIFLNFEQITNLNTFKNSTKFQIRASFKFEQISDFCKFSSLMSS